MIDVKTLKKGDKVRIINNQDNGVYLHNFVKVNDISAYTGYCYGGDVYLFCDTWNYGLWFKPEQLEYLEEDIQNTTIYKSRWDELVNKLTSECSSIVGMTGEEAVAIRSVLKDNTPFCVVDDPIDLVISKEVQTHLDATHVGDTGNFALYYKSELLKKWFWWNDEYTWEECYFKYGDEVTGLFQITISKSI